MIRIKFVFLHRGKTPPSSASKDTLNVSFMAALREYCEPENKWKGTEPEWERTSDDLMELNDTKLN